MRETMISLQDARGPKNLRIYAVGDIHGRLDLLLKIEKLIQNDIGRNKPADWRVVYLGDYVDRGYQSKGVIDHIANQCFDERFIALAGNHDIGFLEFLEMPSIGDVFAKCGGETTAKSYGVEMPFGN